MYAKTLSGLNNDLPLLFDDFLGKDLFNRRLFHFSPTNTSIPAVNIKETDESYEVELAAPGMAKEDFSVRLEGQQLIISSEKKAEAENSESGTYTNREFSYQSFQGALNC